LRRYADALAMVYSLDARRQFEACIQQVQPDLIHLHNIYHQLTPSILDVARQAHIPVIMTLHDYKLVCPRYDMLRHGTVCDQCVEQGPTACLRNRCAGSWAASLLLTCESALHRSRGSYDAVRYFLTPSRFLRRVMERGGWSPERLRHISNFTPAFATQTTSTWDAEGERYLFAGRLSREKGIGTLLAAARQVERGTLVVCGSGPLEHQVREVAAQLPAGRIEWKGHLSQEALRQEIQRASFVVMPSEWFENAPFAALEAMAAARAVLASRIGGLPEMITDDDNGVLVPPGNLANWTQALSAALENPARMRRMGQRAQERARVQFGFEAHMDAVLGIYNEVVQ
jgi:glycosyltransferase involved in cell wall biosynthesis